MADEWIKMRTALTTAPAVISIAARTGLDEFSVVGRLHCLWSWADMHTVDGHALGVTAHWIDRFVGSDGFANAMANVGWLDISSGGIVIPEFDKHNGKSAKSRALTAKRAERHRERMTIDFVTQSALRKAHLEPEPEKNQKRSDLNLQSDRAKTGKSADLVFRSSCEPFARMLYEKMGRENDNDPFLWQLAVLVDYGAIQEFALMEAVESVCLEKRRNPIGYLRRCLERHVGGKANLKAILARVRITKTFPRSPPQGSGTIITPATRKPDDD